MSDKIEPAPDDERAHWPWMSKAELIARIEQEKARAGVE